MLSMLVGARFSGNTGPSRKVIAFHPILIHEGKVSLRLRFSYKLTRCCLVLEVYVTQCVVVLAGVMSSVT